MKKPTARLRESVSQLRSRNPNLTEMETAVMWLVAEGASNKIIGAELGISHHTAKFHVDNALAKLDAATRTRAATRFVLERVDEARLRLNVKSVA